MHAMSQIVKKSFCLVVSLAAGAASATTYYVATTGDDGGAGDEGVGGANVRAGALKNSIVWGNDGVNLSGTVTYACAPEATGETNVSADPRLSRVKSRRYRIGFSSPCAKAGEDGTYIGYAEPFPDGLMLLIR